MTQELPADAWTGDDAARLRELLAAEYEGESLLDYIKRVSPRLPPLPHMLPIIEALQRARDRARDPQGPITIIVIEMPPRHGKTTTVMHGLSWRTDRDGAVTNAYITYGDDLAATKSRLMRNTSTSGGVRLAADMANLAEWRTESGGGLLAGGIMGPLTGKGVDGFLVVDDAIKNREEAESEIYRDKIWDQFTDVCFTRLEGAAAVIVMMTRWHVDDLIGRILERRDDLVEGFGNAIVIEQIRLSAIAEPGGDILGRAEGEALWPAKFPAFKLHAVRKIMGEYGFSAMYQQNPRTKGNHVFHDSPTRFQLWEHDENGRPTGFMRWKPDGKRMLIGCDPAASSKTHADRSAAYVMAAEGFGPSMRTWIVDGFSEQLTIPALVRRLQALREKWWGICVAVEAAGAFRCVPDMLLEIDPSLPVLAVQPKGDKFMRAQPCGAAWNRGAVEVPVDAQWAAPLIKVVSNFTGVNDKRDDEVDAISHGFNALHDAIALAEPRGEDAADYLPFG